LRGKARDDARERHAAADLAHHLVAPAHAPGKATRQHNIKRRARSSVISAAPVDDARPCRHFGRRTFLRIPTQSGRGFRFDVGRRSDLIPATIPK